MSNLAVSTSSLVARRALGQSDSSRPVPTDVGFKHHLDALGFIAISAYKLWCRRNGFSMAQDKSKAERTTELELAREAVVASNHDKSHSPRRAEYIKRVAAGEFDGKPVTELGSRVRRLLAEVSDIDGARDALLRLLHIPA
ncbi:MAG: hypothetical protein QGI68_17085 [Pseudomonadales bacterium]|nr:hypothetical protein [Pseudomonadales bacterium]MDP7597258.1 hypothetical protein [Pseudomonadales bacterium]HJN50264.1 hypothetical protein [Pseudomonadales bacterium]